MKKIVTVIVFFVFYGSFLNAQTIEEVSSLYNARKYEKAEKAALNLVELGVEDARLYMLLGRTLADQGKSADAIDYLERALKIENAPSWVYAWAYAYLGSCASKLGDYTKARDYLNECVKVNATLDATKTAISILNNSGLVEAYDSWAIVETDKIRFHFQDSTQLQLAIKMVLNSVNKLETILKELPCELPKSIDYFVWSNQDEADELLKKKVGFALPEYTTIHGTINETSGHQLVNILSHYSITPIDKAKLIDEGLSVYFSKQNGEFVSEAKNIVKNYQGVFSLKEIWEKGKLYPNEVIYPLGGAWIEFAYKNFDKDELDILLKYQEYSAVKEQLGDKLDEYIIAFQVLISQ